MSHLGGVFGYWGSLLLNNSRTNKIISLSSSAKGNCYRCYFYQHALPNSFSLTHSCVHVRTMHLNVHFIFTGSKMMNKIRHAGIYVSFGFLNVQYSALSQSLLLCCSFSTYCDTHYCYSYTKLTMLSVHCFCSSTLLFIYQMPVIREAILNGSFCP
jgi:hypothetical protein